MISYIFGAFVLLAVVVSLQRLTFGIVVSLALWLFVPAAASGEVVGPLLAGLGSIHPATYVIVAVFIARILAAGRTLGAEVIRSYPILVIVVLFGVTALISNTLGTGTQGLAFVANQAFVPILGFFLVLEAERIRPGATNLLARAFLTMAVVQSLIALAVHNGIMAQPFSEQLQIYRWFAIGEERALGTTDHPLVLSTVLVIAIPITLLIRHPILRTGTLAILAIGVLLTQSRVGVALALAGLVVVVLRSTASGVARGVLLAIGALGAAAMLFSPLGAGVLARISDDGGSSTARGAAFGEVWGLAWNSLILGGGTGRSIDVASSAGLGTSFENPFLMYGFDYGFVIAFLYFGAQLIVVLRGFRSALGVIGASAGLIGLVSIQSFSSVATSNTMGGLIWLVIALAFAQTSAPPTDVDEDTTAAARTSVLRANSG